MPISPDGLEIYSATPTGIIVLRVADLKPLAKLAQGSAFSEVWVSGDGRTLFALSEDAKTLTSMRSDGTERHLINLPVWADFPAQATFITSEQG